MNIKWTWTYLNWFRFFFPRTLGCKSKVCHLETQPCWTGPGQVCWLPLEGWQLPLSKKITHQTHKQRVRVACLAHFRTEVWCSRWRSAAFRLKSRRCWQSSPRNYGGPGTPAAPSHRLPIQTGTSRPSPGTACHSRGSAAGRFRATFPVRRDVPIRDKDIGWPLSALHQMKGSFSYRISFWSSPDCKIFTPSVKYTVFCMI